VFCSRYLLCAESIIVDLTDLATIDEVVDPHEIENLRAQFEAFDTDSSGEIEAEEFLEICLKLGLSEKAALGLVAEIDDNQDGKITFEEYMNHDVLNHLAEAVRQKNKAKDKVVADKESRTHVNVGRIVDIVRAKLDNSTLAFSFMRHVVLLCIYSFVVISQRAPQNAM